MTDREKAGLRGRVAVCETGSDSFVKRESFHADGRRNETSITGNHGSTQRWLYDKENHATEEIFEGPLPFRRRFFYDDRGRLKQVRISDAHGERMHESYTYNYDGSVLHTLYPQLPQGCGVAEDARLYMSADATCITSLQDSGGKTIERVLYDADNRIILRVLFRYNTEGFLEMEGEALVDGGISDHFRNSYSYDVGGRVATIERSTSFGTLRQTMTYNAFGDMTERQNVRSNMIPDEEPAWMECFSYTYDKRGNWIKRGLIHRLIDTGYTSHTGEHNRKIEYWD